MGESVHRFSTRAEGYARYRPGYPRAIITLLEQDCEFSRSSVVADIGSGTGQLARLFGENGNRVYAVEPNDQMREIGERLLGQYPGFVSVNATAEATTLPDHSLDFVAAGQAFHWFDRDRARAEFIRILRPRGWVVLVWNQRRLSSTPFMAGYEQLLLTYSVDYQEVRHEKTTSKLGSFFPPGEYRVRTFDNQQVFDFEGLKGRVLSSSFTPQEGHSNFVPMISALRQLFDSHAADGRVTLEYDCNVYYGHLG